METSPHLVASVSLNFSISLWLLGGVGHHLWSRGMGHTPVRVGHWFVPSKEETWQEQSKKDTRHCAECSIRWNLPTAHRGGGIRSSFDK